MKAILAYGLPLRTEIKRLIDAELAKLPFGHSWQADFLCRLLPYATGGKLMRGSLMCFSYEVFSGQKPDQGVMRTAASLELIHSALLIHDDIMDSDDLRRGKPSMHSQYATIARHQKFAEPNRFGINMAICGADLCIFMALGLLPEQSIIAKMFSEALTRVCDGQMQDIYQQAAPEAPSKRAIYGLMRAKTASYTLSLPLSAGAILAEQPQSVVKKLHKIGEAAGTIFQIRDDELGALGNFKKTGKPVGADIREGKKTLVYYYLMRSCSKPERQRLNSIFGGNNVTSDDIAAAQKLIKQHNVPALINNDIKHLESIASQLLKTLDISYSDKKELKSLMSFCAKRQA